MTIFRNSFRNFFVVTACLIFTGLALAQVPDYLEIGDLSLASVGSNVPAGWKPRTFMRIKRHILCRVVEYGDHHVVKAESDRSASGLVNNLKIDLRENPIIEWRWKPANLIAKADPRHKESDDYPARIYITFAQDQSKLSFTDEIARKISGQDIPDSGLNYIWDNKTPIGTVLPNAYTERLRMVVVQSGGHKLNQWQSEQRNVLEDYRKAFGAEPPLISGVAVMTDTDNTGESATAWYGDLRFKKAPR
ncbi:MAG: DUF3047 domain-containing protein [Burkholderiales bacterium]